MSETTTLQDTGANAEDPPYVPTHVLSSDPEPEAKPDAPAEPEAEAEAAKPELPAKPEKTPEDKARERDNRRYSQIQAARYAEKARADAAEASKQQLEEEVRQLRNPGQPRQAPPADFDKAVADRAEQLLAQREYAAREQKWGDAGAAEFGAEDFNERCNVVAGLASPAQRATLMQVATDMDDGHKAIAALADDPREAERILGLPPHRMALALTKLAGASASVAPPAVAVSRAPAPIMPPTGGRARGEPDPNGSMDDYLRFSAKTNWNRR